MPNLFVTFLASFLIWFMFLGLVILWFIDGRIKKEQAFHALISTLIAWGITSMIKSLIPVERPFESLGLLPLTVTMPHDGSFPSEHTAAAWAMATTIWLHNKKTGSFFIIGALGVGIGRVMSMVHYPQDIVVGVMIGFLVSYLFVKLHLFKVLSGRKM
jgi:undecaprenyl-diphosphatase